MTISSVARPIEVSVDFIAANVALADIRGHFSQAGIRQVEPKIRDHLDRACARSLTLNVFSATSFFDEISK